MNRERVRDINRQRGRERQTDRDREIVLDLYRNYRVPVFAEISRTSIKTIIRENSRCLDWPSIMHLLQTERSSSSLISTSNSGISTDDVSPSLPSSVV